jgi:hypothetical protein
MRARRLLALAWVRRRERGIHARGVRSGSPPGPADRMYIPPRKAD